MNKILIVLPNMAMGGTEQALLSMLKAVDFAKNDVTIALIEKSGQLLDRTPCKVIELPLTQKQRSELMVGGAKKAIVRNMKKMHFIKAMGILFKKLSNDLFSELSFDLDSVANIAEEYDIAISYQIHNPFVTWYVANKVSARKKYVWVHNDFKQTKYRADKLVGALEKYTKIFAVSQCLKSEFIELLPSLADRTDVFYNLIDTHSIVSLASESPAENFSGELKILSVGRLVAQKGFDLAVQVAYKLKLNNYEFVWYIIGDGEEKKKLISMIDKYGLQENVKLLGLKINPYVYINACDIYCQPSRHEGYCTTTNEARVLAKPILTTNVAGAEEQFIDGINGSICDISVEEIYNSLVKLFNSELRKKYSESLRDIEFANNKLWEIFD